MPKPSILMFADSHVRDSPDELFALEQLVAEAIRLEVEAVVGAGDLIDKQRNRARPIAAWMAALHALEEAGIPLWYTQGQHDLDDPPWLSGHRNAHHLHGEVVTIGGIRLYGLDWCPPVVLQEELAAIPAGADVLVAHQVWADWMGDITAPQGEFAQVPVVSAVFSGDYHKTLVERTNGRDGQKLVVVSPGATCQQDYSEPADHHYFTLGDGTAKNGGFRRRDLRSRPFVGCDVLNRPEDLDRLVAGMEAALASAAALAEEAALPEDLRVPRMWVTYSHRLHDTVRRVEKAAAGRALLRFKELPPEDKTAKANAVRAAERGAAVTPLTELAAEVDREEDPELFDFAVLMLESSDRPRAFAAWRARQLED